MRKLLIFIIALMVSANIMGQQASEVYYYVKANQDVKNPNSTCYVLVLDASRTYCWKPYSNTVEDVRIKLLSDEDYYKEQRPYNSGRAWWKFIKSTDKAYMYGKLSHDYSYPYIAISKDWDVLIEGPITEKPCSYKRVKKSDLMPDASNIGNLF